jgi:hypothetical protein
MSIMLLLLAFVGLLPYGFTNGKLSDVGRMIFFAAMIGLCMNASPHARFVL